MDDAGKTGAGAPDLPQPAGPGRLPSTTRHQLQDIAMDMFSAHGYDEVTIEALQGIELKVGPNSIKIDMTGVTISGMMVSISGQVQTQVSGLMTQVSGSAMTQISGAITMIG